LREEVNKPREAEDKVCNDSKVIELSTKGTTQLWPRVIWGQLNVNN